MSSSGVRPGQHRSPYEELALPYDPTAAEQRVKRRRRRSVSRVISLVITVAVMVAIYFWQRDQFGYAALWVIYGIALAVSLGFAVFALLGWLQARKILASMGQGLALRIGRAGVEIAGAFVPWAELGSLAAAKGRVGHGPQLRVTRIDGFRCRCRSTSSTSSRHPRQHRAGVLGRPLGVDLVALEN